ncbi:hypothetical protein MUCCIDRAFT_112851 [Mucor lusitanicus CBS 277.49]|uniref:Uncharacterized protein n=1 Tax=Mucor lusitanicus CBS 277.49 TaxID=747725 RepID=A0A168JNA9_MUCCL|nr:hypothetical protein MUCCIDRAFT_112851 [Mucor lusitanicus CBS 277.49]
MINICLRIDSKNSEMYYPLADDGFGIVKYFEPLILTSCLYGYRAFNNKSPAWTGQA